MRSRQRNAEVADAVRAWQKPSQNAGVRTIGDGTRRECLSEEDPLLSQLIQCRGLNAVVAVAMNMVGVKCINGDEEDIGPSGFGFLYWTVLRIPRTGAEQAAKRTKGYAPLHAFHFKGKLITVPDQGDGFVPALRVYLLHNAVDMVLDGEFR